MKSTIEIKPKKLDSFPALYQSIDNQKITVMFTSEKSGFLVNSGNSEYYSLGTPNTCWTSCYNDAIWCRLENGTKVVLENS